MGLLKKQFYFWVNHEMGSYEESVKLAGTLRMVSFQEIHSKNK